MQRRKLRATRWRSCYLTGLASEFLLFGLPLSRADTIAIAQQRDKNSSEIQNATAEKIFEEGKQLYEQGPEESLQLNSCHFSPLTVADSLFLHCLNGISIRISVPRSSAEMH